MNGVEKVTSTLIDRAVSFWSASYMKRVLVHTGAPPRRLSP